MLLEAAPYRWMFLDVNAFFASVEQQDDPELRGRPVAVVQVEAHNACIIAASYEAKRFGVSTGTLANEALRLCPDIRFVVADHQKYCRYHDAIVAAIETVLPVDKVLSIDEVRIRLLASEADEATARTLAARVKEAIRAQVGESISCSIGLAPNPFLAKIATEIEKPDGLVTLLPSEFAAKTAGWKLAALPGINRRMAVRLNLARIFTIPQLLEATERELRLAFGSVVGARWYHLLRGEDLPDLETKRSSLSHEHVLPPELRTRVGGYETLMRLTEKASARLRREGFAANSATFSCRSRDDRWEATVGFDSSCDTFAFLNALRDKWDGCRIDVPWRVGVVLGGLVAQKQLTMSLFEPDNRRVSLAKAVDKINHKFGKHRILPAGMLRAKDTAPERIAFQKTSLFSEGLGDNAA